jgi:predicted transcriptional regulator
MPNPFISIRVPPEIIKSLDEVALKRGITRPDLIRELLTNCHSFYHFIETEKARQQTDKIILDGNLSQWIQNNMPASMTPEWVRFLGEVMHHVADKMIAETKEKPVDQSTSQ